RSSKRGHLGSKNRCIVDVNLKLGMHRYRYQYRYRWRYFVKILVLVFELPIQSTDTTHQYFTASNWPGYADTKCDLLSYLSYHSLPDRTEEHTSELQSHLNLV